MHNPPHRALCLVAYPSIFAAADHTVAVSDLGPIGLEGFQRKVIENERRKGKATEGAELFPEGDSWLMVEFGADSQEEAVAKARKAVGKIRADDRDQIGIHLIEDEAEQKKAWKIREGGVGASRIPGVEDAWPSWEDAAMPPENLGKYLRDFYKLLDKYHYVCTIFGHFGQGCVHTRITFDVKTVEGVKNYRSFMTEAAHLVVRYGGSLSGEHGDGQARAELLPVMFGPELIQAFREFKSAWDPEWRMNPGKVVDPYPLDTNIRTGPDYKPKPVLTIFQFPDDHGSMAEATERCFGVGKCRAMDGGTMCPSFHATREEMHSTRGRARMLFEMLRGEVIQDGWRDPHIKDALDLCLACKGCKGDCPASVDLATYKAEFLSHYYEGRPRPASAYAMGQIFRWAELGSRFPDAANFVAQTPGFRDLAKRMAGVTQHRKLPTFAKTTFKNWFLKHETLTAHRHDTRPVVMLWPDTFNNHFFPHTAQAAVEVLESAGYRVEVPRQRLCCGRPLYDYGLLDQAKQHLRDIIAALQPQINAGTPVVCLEPSCGSVFRDELTNLFPRDEDAHRLRKQTFLLGDFLENVKYQPPALKRKALVHGHCHQKAIFGMTADQKLLKQMGLEAELLDSGCCGLAGSFGYEADHYDVSMKVGERVLLPKVRGAERDTLIVADGFSCREQIMHATPRHALHLAEVIQMALHQPLPSRKARYIEAGFVQEEAAYPAVSAAAGLSVLMASGLYLFAQMQKGNGTGNAPGDTRLTSSTLRGHTE